MILQICLSPVISLDKQLLDMIQCLMKEDMQTVNKHMGNILPYQYSKANKFKYKF